MIPHTLLMLFKVGGPIKNKVQSLVMSHDTWKHKIWLTLDCISYPSLPRSSTNFVYFALSNIFLDFQLKFYKSLSFSDRYNHWLVYITAKSLKKSVYASVAIYYSCRKYISLLLPNRQFQDLYWILFINCYKWFNHIYDSVSYQHK